MRKRKSSCLTSCLRPGPGVHERSLPDPWSDPELPKQTSNPPVDIFVPVGLHAEPLQKNPKIHRIITNHQVTKSHNEIPAPNAGLRLLLSSLYAQSRHWEQQFDKDRRQLQSKSALSSLFLRIPVCFADNSAMSEDCLQKLIKKTPTPNKQGWRFAANLSSNGRSALRSGRFDARERTPRRS